MLTSMHVNGIVYEVSQRIPYIATPFATSNDVKRAFYFAWDMTFGTQGEHRNHRSGGLLHRRNGQIFANTFQGKLAEFAICDYLKTMGYLVEPDLRVEELGKWDSFDIRVGELDVSVKSTKKFGNLLLLESSDWSTDGVYVHHEGYGSSSVVSLVRVDPSPEDLLAKARLLYADQCVILDLKKVIAPLSRFTFQIIGAISPSDIGIAVRSGHKIPQGALLNAKTTMDADNYYVQACDFKRLEEFIPQLSN